MRNKTVLGIVFVASLAAGRTKAATTGWADLGAAIQDGSLTNAKYLEYRDSPSGFTSSGGIHWDKDTWYLNLQLDRIQQQDQEASVVIGRWGRFRLEGSFNQILHRFATGARTPYSGLGTGYQSLPNGMQKDLQASISTTDMANTMEGDYLPSFNIVDLELKREKSKLELDARLVKGLKLSVDASYERRTGTRPIMSLLTTSNYVELAEPINYDTTMLFSQLEYLRGRFLVQAEGSLSNFENRIDAMLFDNPFRSTDASPTSGSAAYQIGAATARFDLYPDNIAYNGTALGRVELPLKSRLVVSGNWGRRLQNDPLLPYTSNTAIIPGAKGSPPFDASDPSNLPVQNVNARVDTALYQAQLTSRPVRKLKIKAGLRYQEFINKLSHIEFPGVVNQDESWSNGIRETESIAYLRRKASVGAGYDLPLRTTINLDTTHEIFDRSHTREVARSLEDSYKVSLNASPAPWLELRPSFERSRRKVESYDFTAPFPGSTVTAQLPWLRRFDEASRDRRRLGILASVDPLDSLSLTASYFWGEDEFDESAFGLLSDRHKIASVEATYALGKKLTVFGSFSREIFASNAKSRQWTPSGNGDPYVTDTGYDSDSNWTVFTDDRVDTSEAGLEIPSLYKKVAVKASYSESHSDGRIDRQSPVGGATDANNFTPVPFETVDETTRRTALISAKRAFGESCSVQAGFTWEWYQYQDYLLEGFSYVPTTLAGVYRGGLFMGTLPSHYVVNKGFIRMNLTF